jgi:GntR family transcriptional regulator
LLRIAPDARVWRMRRVRSIKGQPASYIVNHALPELMRDVRRTDFEQNTFLSVFQQTCGVRLSRTEQRVRPVVADIDLSKRLGVAFGDPLFFVENTYYDHQATPVEVSYLYYRGDRYVYRATLDF